MVKNILFLFLEYLYSTFHGLVFALSWLREIFFKNSINLFNISPQLEAWLVKVTITNKNNRAARKEPNILIKVAKKRKKQSTAY